MRQTLAITTDIGQAYEARGRAVGAAWAEHHGVVYIPTPPDQTALCDGLIVRDVLCGVAETKVRTKHGYADLKQAGTYLITAAKLEKMIQLGSGMGVASYVIVQLADGVRFWWCVAGPDGQPLFAWSEARTRTKATSVDAFTIQRVNAFLPFSCGHRW